MKTLKFITKKNMIAAILSPDETELGFVSLTVGQATLTAFKEDMQTIFARIVSLDDVQVVTTAHAPSAVEQTPPKAQEGMAAENRMTEFNNSVFLSKTDTLAVVKTRYMTYNSPIETPEVAFAQAITGYGFKLGSKEYEFLLERLKGRWATLKAFDATPPKPEYVEGDIRVSIDRDDFFVSVKGVNFIGKRDAYEELFAELTKYFGVKASGIKELVASKLRKLLAAEAPLVVVKSTVADEVTEREVNSSAPTSPTTANQTSSGAIDQKSKWAAALGLLDLLGPDVVTTLFRPSGFRNTMLVSRGFGNLMTADTLRLRVPDSAAKSVVIRVSVGKGPQFIARKFTTEILKRGVVKLSCSEDVLQRVMLHYVTRLIECTRPATKGSYQQNITLEEAFDISRPAPSNDDNEKTVEIATGLEIPRTLFDELLARKNIMSRVYHSEISPDNISFRVHGARKRFSVSTGIDVMVERFTKFSQNELRHTVDVQTLRKVIRYMVKALLDNTTPKARGVRYETFDFVTMKPKAEAVDVVEVGTKPSVEVTESSYVPTETPAVTLAGFTVPAALDRLSQVPKGTDFARKNWPWFFDASGTFDLLELLKVNEQYHVSVKPRPKGGKYKCDGKRINVEIDRTYDSIRSAVWTSYCSAVMGTGLDNHPQVESVFKEYIDAFTVAAMLELSLHDMKFTKDSKASWYLDFSEETEREVIVDRITFPSGRLRVVSVGKAIDGVFWYIKGNGKGYGPNLTARRIRFDAKPVDEQIDELTSDLMTKTNMPDDKLLRYQLRAILRTEAKRVGNGLL